MNEPSNFSPYLIKQISDAIDDNIKAKCIDFLYDSHSFFSNEKDFIEDYILNILQDTFVLENKLINPKEIRNPAYKRRQSNKKNWLQTLKKDIKAEKPNPIFEDIELAKKVMDKKVDTEHLKKLFGVEKPEDILKIKLKEVEAWAKSKKTNITDFLYLDSKMNYQIEKAFHTDFTFLIAEIILEKYNGNLSNWIDKRLNSWVEAPIFSNESHSLKTNMEVKTNSQEVVLYNDYKVDEEYFIRTIIPVNDNQTVLSKRNMVLDPKDSQIIQFALSQRDEMFYKEKTVTLDLADIVKEIYNSKGVKNYEAVEARIMKIARYHVEGVAKKKNSRDTKFAINFFQKAVIETDEVTGRRYATIVFSDDTHQGFLNQQFVQIYSDVIKKFKDNSLSSLLLYAFQKERLDCYLQEKSYTHFYPYQYFASKVRFRSKKIDVNLKLINESLAEFVSNQVLIQSYQQKLQGFEISFIPLQNYEIQDYFGGEHRETLEG
ncbi:hypothetical protein Q4S57_11800 [Priestia megaterium]|uniref:hypothetical protein n=1 Tax=Priestia megaterium TaxID=1404 RepID=UPI0026E4331C|nr:hypothetical protein [Priestia megaterium]MDO6848635.1 hypothetical protein [Priestia megaterium]